MNVIVTLLPAGQRLPVTVIEGFDTGLGLGARVGVGLGACVGVGEDPPTGRELGVLRGVLPGLGLAVGLLPGVGVLPVGGDVPGLT
jgi:hypothetical protein